MLLLLLVAVGCWLLLVYKGNTALIVAADKGHEAVVDLLIKAGADVNNQDKDVSDNAT